MTLYVFTGPTLSAEEGRRELDAVFLPPVAQGDVYLVARKKPSAIGIIDGFFEHVLSVSHKEILWAMSQGIHVFGAASMGALRAAELEAFGMVGVGAVFEAFRAGDLEADDEVAITHATAEERYRPTSVAMVDIRATLCAAEAAGAIGGEARTTLERIGKKLFYPDRCYPILMATAAKDGVAPEVLNGLCAFIAKHGQVDRKRLDALAMLRNMRESMVDNSMTKRITWHFEHTDAWEYIRRNAEQRNSFSDHHNTHER